MRITRRALASTYVLRHLITAALDFGTGKRRSTPGREYDFESEVEDEEDLSPKNGSWTGVRNGGETEEDQSPKYGSWTEVLSTGVGLESGTEVGTEEDRSPQWSWTGGVPESNQRLTSKK